MWNLPVIYSEIGLLGDGGEHVGQRAGALLRVPGAGSRALRERSEHLRAGRVRLQLRPRCGMPCLDVCPERLVPAVARVPLRRRVAYVSWVRRVIELRAELQRAEGKRGQEDERDPRRERLRRELLRVAIPIDHPRAEFDTTLNRLEGDLRRRMDE